MASLLPSTSFIDLNNRNDDYDITRGMTSKGFKKSDAVLDSLLRLLHALRTDRKIRMTVFDKDGAPSITLFVSSGKFGRPYSTSRILAFAENQNQIWRPGSTKVHSYDPLQVALFLFVKGNSVHLVNDLANLPVHALNDLFDGITHRLFTILTNSKTHRNRPIRIPIAKSDLAPDALFGTQNEHDIIDSEAFVEIVLPVLRPLTYVYHQVRRALVYKFLMLSSDDEGPPQTISDLSEIFLSLASIKANVLTVQDNLSKLSVLLNDKTEMECLISSKEKLVHLSHLFVDLNDNLEISNQIVLIFIRIGEYDSNNGRNGLMNLGSCFADPKLRAYFALSTKNALENHNGDLFGNLCRLRQVLSLWSGIRLIYSPELLAIYLKTIEMILRGLQIFVREPEVLVRALGGLETFLSVHEDCKERFVNKDGIAVIVAAMQLNKQSEEVNNQCCKILNCITEGHIKMEVAHNKKKDEACAAVSACLGSFMNYTPLAGAACSFLTKMAAIGPREAEKLVQMGARNIIQIMRHRHAGNPCLESLLNQLLAQLDVSNTRSHVIPDSLCNADDVRAHSRALLNEKSKNRLRADRSCTANSVRMGRRQHKVSTSRGDRRPPTEQGLKSMRKTHY